MAVRVHVYTVYRLPPLRRTGNGRAVGARTDSVCRLGHVRLDSEISVPPPFFWRPKAA